MGAQSSKYLNLASEVSSYEAVCREDPIVQSYDSKLQQSTSQFVNTLVKGAKDGSTGNGPLSLNSVKELTGCLGETTQRVTQLILQYKIDISNNADMHDLVNEYFNCSYQIVQFCNELEKCLKSVRLSHSQIQVAIEQFEEERKERVHGRRITYSKTLKLLENFKTTGRPFTEEFSSMLTSVYEKQKSMLEKVREKKKQLDKKLKSMKAWKIVSNVIFGATCASVLICSFMAAAIASPPSVVVLGTVTAAGLEPMGRWMNFLWMNYENQVKGKIDITSSIENIGKADLENIQAAVDKLKDEFVSLSNNADFAPTEEAAVQTMEEMKKKLSGFMETIQELSEHTEKCRVKVTKGRKEILEKIINNRNFDAQSSKIEEQEDLNRASEVSSYEAACREDLIVQSYDTKLQQSTSQFIDTFVKGAKDGSAGNGPLSLNSVKELTGYLVDRTQGVAELILQFELEILKNDDMFDLVNDYFNYSFQLVQLFNALQKCLKHARLSHSKIQVAIEQFEEEQKERDDGKRITYSKTLKLLENFNTTGFTEEFSSMFTSVYEMQKSMLEKVREKKKKLDKKLKSMNAWRTVLNVIFGATCASVLICSFVAAAIAARPFVAVLGAVSAAGLAPMGKWMNSLWMSYEKEVKGKIDITSSINKWILIGKADLENIQNAVDKLKNEFVSLSKNADSDLTEDAAVRQTMEEMKTVLSGFMKTIQELSEHTETCRVNVMNGRKEILEKIINNRN